ncbi:MAG: ABC transporter substrate-binding protein [Spirochaetales bacterium]|nr:ABC transporter substrate-binding protein [Spirochaetales bacterium]
MKKIISLFLITILSIAFVNANGKQEVSSEGVTTVTIFSYDPIQTWNNMDDEIGKVITEKTGVKLQYEFAIGDAEQRTALIAASGIYPDLISPKSVSASMISQGALLDLTNLINEHAPNMKKMLGDQMKRLRYSADNKAIYFIPTYSVLNKVDFDTDAWFKLQLGALKESNYPAIKTLKDYEQVISDYVKKHPTTKDGLPTIGLSLLADDWRYVISVTNPSFWATGAHDDGEWFIDPETFKAKEHYFRPEAKEYFRWLNHMNDIGLLDIESFTQKYDQYLSKIASGRVVGLIDANWEIGDAINSLKAEGKYEQMYGRFPAVLEKGMKAKYNQSVGFDGGWGVAITKEAKDPVKLIKFFDYLASEEGQILINWGIEGKHWEMKDGKRVFTEEAKAARNSDMNKFAKEVGVGNYNNISLRYGDGVKDSTGNYFTTTNPENIKEGYTEEELAALDAYGVDYWGDLIPPATDFPIKKWGAAWNIPISEDSILKQHWDIEQNIVRRRITELIWGNPADFDKGYDAFLTELDKATSPMASEMTALIKNRIRLWNE